MYFDLSNGKKPGIFDNRVPGHLRKYTLPFSQCIYKEFDEGRLLTQWILGSDYSIWVHYFFIDRSVLLHANSPAEALALNYMLNGDVSCVLKGNGEVLLKENRYQLLYVPAQVFADASFVPGAYCCMHINFHPSRLISIVEQYPLFYTILSQVENKLHKGTCREQAAITPYIRTLIEEIITCDMGVRERTLIIESRIRELLRLYIHHKETKDRLPKLRSSDMEILIKLEEYILANLDKDISVNRLAAVAGVGRSWLQQICKRQYGKGIHEFVIDKRMAEAANLLLRTALPVGEIVQKVSAMTFSSFCAAFYKYFHMTPGAYRRSRGQNQQK